METEWSKSSRSFNFPFYPTYKEWKPCKRDIIFMKVGTFYPTYKEWKHFCSCNSHRIIVPFYPTYKEWKQK